jgi:SAM-dependent methyltransferase
VVSHHRLSIVVSPLTFPERIVPDETEPGIVAIHLKRYDFALPHCAGKDVLDAACGVGYGSSYLARQSRSVLGVDVDPGSIAYARTRYADDSVRFERMDVLDLELPDESFDAVCSFETVEHLDDPERGIGELGRVLRRDGVLILSTPHVAETTSAPDNPHHRVELSVADLRRLLDDRFEEVQLFGQRRAQTVRHRVMRRLDVFGLRRRLRPRRGLGTLLGTPSTAALTLDDVLIDERRKGATEIVAVCRHPRR